MVHPALVANCYGHCRDFLGLSAGRLKDEIITDQDCNHDWTVHNDIGMDMVYCPLCDSVKRDRELAMLIFFYKCTKIPKEYLE